MDRNPTFHRAGYLNENYHYFHLRDSAGQERSYHFHEFDKIVLLLSGRVDYVVENVTYTLLPGSVLLVRHHAIHRAMIDRSEPYERIILYLDSSYFERALPSAGLTSCFETADRTRQCLLLPDSEQKQAIRETLRAYEAVRTDEQAGADALRDTLIMQLLIHINRISSAAAESERRYDGKIHDTLSYINEHLTEDLSVETLAARVFLSRYHFMRLFKTQTGSTVHAYVRQKRLLYAARLIREGTPAGQAALACGFNDYSVFNRAFHTCFGIRPADLKK